MVVVVVLLSVVDVDVDDVSSRLRFSFVLLCRYSENSTIALCICRDSSNTMWNEHVLFLDCNRLSVNTSFLTQLDTLRSS